MYRYYCQEFPHNYTLTAQVLAIEESRILVDRSPFFPGGGGQLADRGVIVSNGKSITVNAVEIVPHGVWHTIDRSIDDCEFVDIKVDENHRSLQSELHTLAHIVNAVVFKAFDGALLTGAQLGSNGTLRIDFDLPGVDNDRLRVLEEPINEAAQQAHEVSAYWMPWDKAKLEHGLFRAKSAAPPKGSDGMVRIVQIGTLDKQACGGTHVTSTDMCRSIRITKIENKGKQNRRIRVGIHELI